MAYSPLAAYEMNFVVHRLSPVIIFHEQHPVNISDKTCFSTTFLVQFFTAHDSATHLRITRFSVNAMFSENLLSVSVSVSVVSKPFVQIDLRKQIFV